MKNKLYASTDEVIRYQYYTNKMLVQCVSTKRFTSTSGYFEANMSNIEKTWAGINELLFRR